MGYLEPRPIATEFQRALGRQARRFLVQRVHVEHYGVRPDVMIQIDGREPDR